MLGFLFKILLMAALVSAAGAYFVFKDGALPQLSSLSQFSGVFSSVSQKVDVGVLAQNIGASLDSLVTHGNTGSPLVLGVKVTNDSLNAVVDTLFNLPPDQLRQIQSALCAPATDSGINR